MKVKRSMRGTIIFFSIFPMFLIGAETIAEITLRMKDMVDRDVLTRTLTGVAIIVIITAAIVGFIIIRYFSRMMKAIGEIVEVLQYASTGDLTRSLSSVTSRRTDEIGALGNGVGMLIESLAGLVGKLEESSAALKDHSNDLNDSAREVGSTIDNISTAVVEMAKGASVQSDETGRVARDIFEIGKNIESISVAVMKIEEKIGQMKELSDSGVSSANELETISANVEDRVHLVVEQTHKTNDSANLIHEVTDLIVSIASQTNLLSLNASIEAARAGESGKGFAVVAEEIKSLAEETNNSAKKIAEITEGLKVHSDESVSTMNEVRNVVSVQGERIEETKQLFVQVNEGLELAMDQIHHIAESTMHLDKSKGEVIDSMEQLSSISEENSAATQETAASAEEMNATIHGVVEQSERLKTLSEYLDKEMSYFMV